jgi:O-methyltransferase
VKLFFIRYTKIFFLYLRLDRLFKPFSSLFFNLYYLTRFSSWHARNRKISYNDFPSKWDYNKRYDFYKWVVNNEGLDSSPINYFEFGVAGGYSFKWWLENNQNDSSRFFGFDTFEGLPEKWGGFEKGAMAYAMESLNINDHRASLYKGLFQHTLPGFLKTLDNSKKNVVFMDADLYSATLFTLTTLAPFLKKDDIVFFDEFAVPTHEFKAFSDFEESYYIKFQLIAAANNYYFTGFKVV